MLMEAEKIQMKYEGINIKFSQVHQMISHTNPIPAEQVTQTVQYIEESCMFLREHLPTKRAFPKVHILEDNVTELTNNWILGLGLRGAHGEEI